MKKSLDLIKELEEESPGVAPVLNKAANVLRTNVWVAFESTLLISWAALLKPPLGGTAVQLFSSVFFIVEAAILNADEGIGYHLHNTLDLFLCLLLPLLLVLTEPSHNLLPLVTLRIITLVPRSRSVYQRALQVVRSTGYKVASIIGQDSGQAKALLRGVSYKSNSYEKPSEIPVLRLTQLLLKIIHSSRTILNKDEKDELKILTLKIVHHELYTSTQLSNNIKEDTEAQQIKDNYTLGIHHKPNPSERVKGSSSDADDPGFLRERGVSALQAAGRFRGISAPQSTRPGQGVSLDGLSIQSSVDNYLSEVLDDWDFNVFQLSRIAKGRPLTSLALYIFNDARYMWEGVLSTNKFHFETFVSCVEDKYGHNLYHNKFHAADVTQSVHYCLMVNNLQTVLNSLESFSLIFAAIIHDFKHPGLTNSYLMKTMDPIAITYNDSSVLENFHVSSAFKLLLNDKMNFLKNLKDKDRKKIRELVIGLVLATDLKQHFDFIAQFKAQVATMEVTVNDKNNENLYLLAMKICVSLNRLLTQSSLMMPPTR